MQNTKIFLTVFRQPWLVVLAVIIAWLIFTGAVWLPNIGLITSVLGSSASLVDKLTLLGSLYRSIGTNFTIVSTTYTLLIALLFGIQIALLYYYIHKTKTNRASLRRVSGTSLGGLVAGIFGIGCAACGTFILTALLSLVGAGGILAFLPFGGEEFGFLGVGLLLYSIWLLLKKLQAPNVCPV
jgi:small-conductance mechanosensitive channel